MPCVCIDLRGFGRSSSPEDPQVYGTKIVTTDLAKLLGMNLTRAHPWRLPTRNSNLHRMLAHVSTRLPEPPARCVCRSRLGRRNRLAHVSLQPERVLAVCGICTPYFPQRDQLVDVNTLAVAIPQFSYMKFLSQSEEAAKILDAAPKRLFTATYRFPEEHEVDGVSVPYLEILHGVAGSPNPMYTERSELLSEEELDVYVREYSRSGFKGPCNYYAVRATDFETENPLPRVIPHRALYIGAGADKVLMPEMAAHMPHFVPNLETALVKGAGHWLLCSHTHEVTEILLNWLGKAELSDATTP